MKKIFLMFILTFNFSNAEIIKNLSALKHKSISSPSCVSSYNLIPTYREFWVYSYQKPTQAPTKMTFTELQIENFIIDGYEWDTIKATCTLSPIPPPEPTEPTTESKPIDSKYLPNGSVPIQWSPKNIIASFPYT